MTQAYPRLRRDFDALSQIGRDPQGGWTRHAFGPADRAAHAWFAQTAEAAGLTVRTDAFGNAIARMEGPPGARAVVIGSHLDTVANGGLYDGALGVLAGLEVARRLIDANVARRNAVEVIAFRDEEGRFGAFSGSRAMMGALTSADVPRMRAADGEALADTMSDAGFDPAGIAEARRDPREIAAYIELHIEQGPVLETTGRIIGVVDAIAGQERLSVRFTGAADHAGTTPMDMRRDAFAAAARFADTFRTLIIREGGATARGTIGIVKVTPNAGNVVPSEARLGLEIRDVDVKMLAWLTARAIALAADAADAMRVAHQIRRGYSAPPVAMNERLAALLRESAGSLGHEALTLPSGAGHDAGVIGVHAPACMLFVPSVGGRSHCPEEHTEWAHIEQGVAVLEATARRLVAMAPPAVTPAAS